MILNVEPATVYAIVPVVVAVAGLVRWAKTPHKDSHKRMEAQISEIYTFVIHKT